MEVLVAVAILAIIGVVASRSLSSLIATGEALKSSQSRLARVELFFALLDQDLRTMIPKQITTSDGVLEPFEVSTDPVPRIEITRSGVSGGRQLPSGPLRVVYTLEQGVISRRIRFLQGKDEGLTGRELITGVRGISVVPIARAIDTEEEEKEYSPDQVRVPAGVRLDLEIEGFGNLERLFFLGVGK